MNEKAASLAVLPADSARLLAEYRSLQKEVARLLTEKDHLVKNVGPRLEAELELKLGVCEFEVLSLETDIRFLRRKLELLSTKVVAGKTLSTEVLTEIDEQLEEQFTFARKHLQGLFEKIIWSRLLVDSILPAEDYRRMSKFYRQLALKLHPQVNPDLPAEYKDVWEQVATAYRNGEQEDLTTLEVMVRSMDGEEVGSFDLEQATAAAVLTARIDNLKASRRRIKKQLRGMKVAHPFRLAFQDESQEWVKEQYGELQEKIRKLQQEKLSWEAIVSRIINGVPAVLH